MIDVHALGRRVSLSREECWLLYVWLGQDAPFVRNQLSVVRNGGGAPVRISSQEEASQVRGALDAAGDSALSDGLSSLRLALAAAPADV